MKNVHISIHLCLIVLNSEKKICIDVNKFQKIFLVRYRNVFLYFRKVDLLKNEFLKYFHLFSTTDSKITKKMI